MSVASFDELIAHSHHHVEVVTYGNPPVNAAIECLDCGEVLMDFDRPVSDPKESQCPSQTSS